MKEQPILFSGPMVRAILAGRKTQTRCVVTRKNSTVNGEGCNRVSPRFVVGDRLWVRETWQPIQTNSEWLVKYAADGALRDFESNDIRNEIALATICNRGPIDKKWRYPNNMPRWACRITLEITDVRVERLQEISETDAKAEGAECVLYHEVSHLEENIQIDAHGPSWLRNPKNMYLPRYKHGFMHVWDSINGKRGCGWDSNPWVWVIEFKRVEGGQP